MKTKEKKVNSIVLTVFSLVTVLLIALRTVISKKYIEAGTGFYVGGESLVSAFNIILGVFTVVAIAYPLIRFRGKRFNIRPDGRAMGIASLIIAAGFVYDVYSTMTIFSTSKACHHFISLFSSANTETTNIVVDILQGYMLLIGAIFALLSLIYFVIMTMECLGGAADYSKRRILALAPVWWCVFRAVYFILVPMNFPRISDMLYELIMVGFMLLFFVSFARVASRVDGENCAGKTTAYGACAAVFAAISSVPRLVAKLMGAEGVVYTSPQDIEEVVFKSDYFFMALAAFVFCAVFVFYAMRKISDGRAYLEGENEEALLSEIEQRDRKLSDAGEN